MNLTDNRGAVGALAGVFLALNGGCTAPQSASAPLPTSVLAIARGGTTEVSLIDLANEGSLTLQVCLESAVLQQESTGATCGLGLFGACLDVAPRTTVARVPFTALASCALPEGDIRALLDVRVRRQLSSNEVESRGDVWRTTTLLTYGQLRRVN